MILIISHVASRITTNFSGINNKYMYGTELQANLLWFRMKIHEKLADMETFQTLTLPR